jgi:hypothetical protein
LRYIAQWFEEHYLDEPLILTDSTEQFSSYSGPRIFYSDHPADDRSCWIKPVSLLFEEEVQDVLVDVKIDHSFPILFQGAGEMGFDLLAASFYLITRYEEYLPYSEDEYGRYAHEQSLAFRNGFLMRPLVDEWMQAFCSKLRKRFPELRLRPNTFQHVATYDIDESFAYLHKPWWLQLGGAARDLLAGRIDWMMDRIRVLAGIKKDPYDSFDEIRKLHVANNTRPICFIHVGARRGRYDRQISPHHPAQQRLIYSLCEWSDIGLHPSWRSGDEHALLPAEKKVVEQIVNQTITRARQHYIRYTLPETYRGLIGSGITDEYSMGYGSINGFRASTARSFRWFDLKRNITTSLRVHPFCYMEANSFFECKQSVDEAASEWCKLEKVIREVNGCMITIWHNNFLGTQKRFEGWGDRYAAWLRAL